MLSFLLFVITGGIWLWTRSNPAQVYFTYKQQVWEVAFHDSRFWLDNQPQVQMDRQTVILDLQLRQRHVLDARSNLISAEGEKLRQRTNYEIARRSLQLWMDETNQVPPLGTRRALDRAKHDLDQSDAAEELARKAVATAFYEYIPTGQTKAYLLAATTHSVAAWKIVLLAIVPSAILVVRHRLARGHWRMLAGLCPGCGYDLRATPERCPECGKAQRRKNRPNISPCRFAEPPI
jgi:hypothetical protein